MSLEEFAKGLRDSGLDVSDAEAEEVFTTFDTDESGTINMTEFLIGIRVSSLQHETVINIIYDFFDFFFYCSLTCLSREKG